MVEPDSRAELVENLARVRLVVALMRLQLGESHLGHIEASAAISKTTLTDEFRNDLPDAV